MLLTNNTKVKWNSKNKKHYEDLGYVFTKMGNEFVVNVNDLTKGSSAIVNVRCDYCNCEYTIPWIKYNRARNNNYILKDCCSSPSCTGMKAHEVLKKKYNFENSIWEVKEIIDKRNATNIERYGCENPFGNEEVREKIRQYNLSNYNVEYSMQRKEVVEKSKNTCLEKYGVSNYGKIYSESHTGELSPTWKGGVLSNRQERSDIAYRTWRNNVFSRDSYTCQYCGSKNGNGKYVRLEAHHIFDWKNHTDKRYDVDNGSTLCSTCHNLFHSIYGKKGNDKDQFYEFLNNRNLDEKIC